MRRIRLAIVSVLVLTAFVGGYLWRQYTAAPERVAERIASALEDKDWRTLMSLAEPNEVELNGWTADKFARLASTISEHVRPNPGSVTFSRVGLGDAGVLSPETSAIFELKIAGMMADPPHNLHGFQFILRKDQNGVWRPMVSKILTALNRFDRTSRMESVLRLSKALKEAELPAIRSPEGWEFNAERLQMAIEGKIKEEEIGSAIGGSELTRAGDSKPGG